MINELLLILFVVVFFMFTIVSLFAKIFFAIGYRLHPERKIEDDSERLEKSL